MGFPALPNTFSYDSQKWTTDIGNGDADFATRTVFAPTDLSRSSRFQRAHANASVRLGHEDLATFCRENGVPAQIAHACDYARVSSALQQSQSIAHNGSWDEHEGDYYGTTSIASRATDYAPPDRLPHGALTFYESTDDILTGFDLTLRSLIGGTTVDWSEYHRWQREPVDPTAPDANRRRLYKQTVRLALIAAAEHLCPYEDEPSDSSLEYTTYVSNTEVAARRAWEIISNYLNRESDDGDIIDPHDRRLASDEWDDDYREREWCQMHLVRPTLMMPHSAELRRRAWRMSDEGAMLRSPHRAFSDGRVFGTIRRKRDSGSVLIDTSGSMSLHARDIDEIMLHLPGVTVATYCSDAQLDGELRIVAAKGRRAPTDQLTNEEWYGNGVDGPALRWLAKQPQPRYWVCDGIVTGVHDGTNSDLREECQHLTKKYHITRIDSLHQLRLGLSSPAT